MDTSPDRGNRGLIAAVFEQRPPRPTNRGTERRIAFARLMLVCSGFFLYPLIDGRPGTHSTLAWTLLVFAAVYAVALVVHQPKLGRPVRLSFLTSSSDAFFVMLWLWATGGFDSPFYLAIYLGTVSNSVRYATKGTLFAAAPYGIGYAALFFLTGLDLVERIADFAIRLVYLGMAAITGVVVAREIAEENEARFAMETEASTQRMEARLARSERMASLGTLAGGVAHEINNPLTYVVTNVQATREVLREEGRHDLDDLLCDAEEGASRIRRIVSDLKTFAHEAPPSLESTDLAGVIASAVSMAAHQTKHRARIVEEIGPLPRVKGDETRLGQVMLNLLVNAAQAIPAGNADVHHIRIRASQGGDRVVVEVEDDGPGIAPHVLPRIFDPFFTTRDPGVGTGLGLSLCHRIVSDLGGEIDVRSALGKGTTVRVSLRVAEPAPPLPERKRAPAEGRRGLRVLIIDDEPAVARAVARCLSTAHDVEVTGSAREALARIDEGAAFDIVLCDLMMPVMTGMDFFHALEEKHPALTARCVFMTGGAYTPQASRFLASVPNRVLEKPFDVDEALRTLDEVAGA